MTNREKAFLDELIAKHEDLAALLEELKDRVYREIGRRAVEVTPPHEPE